jgi:hypothetical protein
MGPGLALRPTLGGVANEAHAVPVNMLHKKIFSSPPRDRGGFLLSHGDDWRSGFAGAVNFFLRVIAPSPLYGVNLTKLLARMDFLFQRRSLAQSAVCVPIYTQHAITAPKVSFPPPSRPNCNPTASERSPYYRAPRNYGGN